MQLIDHEVIVAVLLFLGAMTVYAYRKTIYEWILRKRTINYLTPYLSIDQVVTAFDQPYKLYAHNYSLQNAPEKMAIIPYLHEKLLHTTHQGATHFLLLGPSGSGKTTTLIQLVKSIQGLDYHSAYKLHFYSTSYPNLVQLLAQIPQPHNSILLLDGLDEDPAAILNFRRRVDQLLSATANFKKVLISSRTHFFPDYMVGDEKQAECNYVGEEHFQTFEKIRLLPLVREGIPEEFQLPQYSRLIQQFHNLPGTMPPSFSYRYEIWEKYCLTWIQSNIQGSASSKLRESESWHSFLVEAAEKMYLHLKEGQLPYLSQAEFQNLVWKHEISPREMSGELLRITPDMKVGTTHQLLLAYLLAKGVFEKQLPIAYVMENWIPEIGSFYAEMCFARLFHSIHESEGSVGYGRYAPDYEKVPLEEIPVDQYASINRLYLSLYQHLDFRFLYSMRNLKAIYILEGNVRDIKSYIIPQLPNRPFSIYLIPKFGTRRIFCANRGRLEERFFRSSLNPYEAFPSRAAKNAKSWLLSEFDTNLSTLPNDACKLDKVSVQDSNHLLRIYAYTPPRPEWSVFDQISLYVFTDGTMNIRMSNSYEPSDFKIHLAKFVNRIVTFYSEDDTGRGVFTQDDAAQIEDGIWEGRVWAWKKTDSYAHPVHLYMETPDQVEFVLWGVRNEP